MSFLHVATHTDFLTNMVWCTQTFVAETAGCTHVCSYRDGVVHTDFSYKKWWGAHRFFTYTNILYIRVPNRVLYVYKTCFVGAPVPNMFCTCTEHVQNIFCIVLTGIVLTVWGLCWYNFCFRTNPLGRPAQGVSCFDLTELVIGFRGLHLGERDEVTRVGQQKASWPRCKTWSKIRWSWRFAPVGLGSTRRSWNIVSTWRWGSLEFQFR